MSLINDVLRDLEARRGSRVDPLAGIRAEPVARRRRPLVWVGLASLVAAGLAGGSVVWLRTADVAAPVAASPQPAPAPVAAAAEPAAQPAAARVRLQAVSLAAEAGRLQLQLGLERGVDYRTERSADGRTLTVRLPGTKATTSLPPMSGLAEAHLREDDQDLILTLVMPEPARVQSSLERRADGALLSLTLSTDTSPPAAPPAPEMQPPATPAAGGRPAAAIAAAQAPAAPAPGAESPPVFKKRELPPTPAELAARAYAAGTQALSEGQMARAEAAFRDVLSHDARHVPARGALAQLLVDRARLSEAEQILREGLAAVGQERTLVQQLARLLAAQQRDADAVSVLEAGLPSAAGEGEYLALLAALYQRQGRFPLAAQLYDAALRSRPTHGAWRIGQAIALESAGDPARAAAAYRAALQGELSGELRAYALQRSQALGVRSGAE